jgi:hypothetical protein
MSLLGYVYYMRVVVGLLGLAVVCAVLAGVLKQTWLQIVFGVGAGLAGVGGVAVAVQRVNFLHNQENEHVRFEAESRSKECCDKFCVPKATWNKCYRRQALALHPDRGGSKEDFQVLGGCNEDLKDSMCPS